MVHVLVKQTVKDFNTWKKGFLDHADARKAAGSSGGILYVNPKENNQVFILFEWDNIENMKKFMESDEIKAEMKKFSAGAPEISVMNKITEFQS